MLTFGLMTAVLASGYGVMFTVLDDFRDDYGIRAEWLGVIVGRRVPVVVRGADLPRARSPTAGTLARW